MGKEFTEMIASVTVTYNRLEELKQNIEHLLHQTRQPDVIYVIDNASTDGTGEYLRSLQKEISKLRCLRMKQNTGGSGGFSAGIRKAYKDGADFIWGMDDDAYPEPEALEKLMGVYQETDGHCAMWSNCNGDTDFDETGRKEVNSWMFVGFLLPRKLVAEVGFPHKDFFIYYDDAEYAYRLRKHGWSIIKARDSIVIHKDLGKGKAFERYLFRGTPLEQHLCYPDMADWRVYYEIRNKLLMYGRKDKNWWRMALIEQPKIVMGLMIMNPRQTGVAIRGYLDGVFGRSGIRMKP